MEIEASADAGRRGAFLLHIGIHINEELALTRLVALQILQGNLICDLVLAHRNVADLLLVRRGRPGAHVVSIWSEGHYMAHVRLGEFLDCTTTIALALLVSIVDNGGAGASGSILLLLVACQDPHMHLVVALVAPVIL